MCDDLFPDAHSRNGGQTRPDKLVHIVNLLQRISERVHMQRILQLVPQRAAGKPAYTVQLNMHGRRSVHYAPFIRALSSSESALMISKVVSMPTNSSSSTMGMAWKIFSRNNCRATLIRSVEESVATPVVMTSSA